MKRLILIIAIVSSGMTMKTQEVATFNQVADKEVKGNLKQYTSKSGVVYSLGDTLRIGNPCRKSVFDFVTNSTNNYMAGWVGSSRNRRAKCDETSGLTTVIKTMKVTSKKLYVTTYSEVESLVLNITDFEEAIKLGEIIKPGFNASDKTLATLKKAN